MERFNANRYTPPARIKGQCNPSPQLGSFCAPGANSPPSMKLLPERVTLPAKPVKTAPDAPEALVATEVTGFSFLARWTEEDTATNYHLDVAEDAEFITLAVNDLYVGGVTTHGVEGLDPDTSYFFRVRASNADGVSPNSNTREVTTAGVLPGHPTALDANDIQDTQFNARWTVADYADTYLLSVSIVSDFSSHLIGYNDLDVGNVTNAVVSGLDPDTTYYYRIRASNAFGTGAFSNVITTQTQVALPEAPVALAGTDEDAESFIANWEAAVGADDYRLDVSVASDFSSFVADYESRVVVGTSQSVIGLDPDTTYYYRVRSANAAGFSGNSNTISIATLVALPETPVALDATDITEDGFTTNWELAANATSYRLDVSTASDFSSFVAGYQDLDVGDVVTYPVAGLDATTTYYYRVRGVNAWGTGGNSNAVTTQTTSLEAPVALESPVVAHKGITAQWGAVAGATSYQLDVSASADFSSYVSGYASLNVGDITSWEVFGLVPETTCYYRVRAVNANGTSAHSNVITTLTAAASIVPTDYALWLKADALVGLVDGDPVSTWEDASANGYDATESGAVRPIYKTNIQNGLPVVRFDGSHYLDLPTIGGSTIMRNVPGATIFAALSTPYFNGGATTVGRTFYATVGASRSGAEGIARVATSPNALSVRRLDEDSPAAIVSDWDPLSFGLQATRYSFQNQNGELVRDGFIIATEENLLTPGNTADTDSAGVRIGATPSGAQFFHGDLGELIVFRRELTAVERKAWDCELLEKWGLL